MNDLLEAALARARDGWPVFPCDPNPTLNTNTGKQVFRKKPLTSHGFKDATRDEKQIVSWWQNHPDAMIGVPTGKATGVFVLDLDVDPEAGLNGIEAMRAFGELPTNGPISRTPRGGRHYFFKWRDGIGNSRGRLPFGVDVRGEGGYVVIPPSRRSDGKMYKWENPLGLFPPVEPPSFVTAAKKPKAASHANTGAAGDRERAYADAALAQAKRDLGHVPEPGRNEALNGTAFHMGTMVGAGWISESEVAAALIASCHRNGLIADDGMNAVNATIKSGLTAGIAKPHGPLPDREEHGKKQTPLQVETESAPENRHALAKRDDDSSADDAEHPGDDGSAADDGSDDSRDRMLVLPPPSEPMKVARAFVARHCMRDGAYTLRYWRGGWWAWLGTHWAEREARSVRAMLYKFTERAVYFDGEGFDSWSPTRKKIGDLLEALDAIVILNDEFSQPSWLDERRSGTIVATANGLLDVESEHLLMHTPQFFNVVHVPFNYDRQAPEPVTWLKFLNALWPHEPDAITTLGEWFGYVISGRTDLHKILLMVGPTRGGKGVIARVLTALIGRRNVAGPTLNSLGGDFGLAPLIGKSLAIISDARFAGKNNSIVIERLLSISGEDRLTVNIKYKEQWTGQLPARLHVISNELPKLGDASTAIVGRLILLLLSHSWLGKEDLALERRLQDELPGILNWSLSGLRRLTDNGGRFTRIASTEEAIVAMRDLASPVGAFVRERCKVGSDYEVTVDTIYADFKAWADNAGHAKMAKDVFGRNLRAAVPSVRKTRPRDGTDRQHVYTGIALREAGEADGDEPL